MSGGSNFDNVLVYQKKKENRIGKKETIHIYPV